MLAISKFNFDFFLNKKLYFIFYIILLRFIPITADASYFIVAGYALLGRQQIIESLFLMWLFSMLNAEIIPHTGNESVIRYIVVLTCFLSILIRANFKKIDIFALITLLLGIFFVIHSIFYSQLPSISILKSVYWTLIMMILFLAWQGMSNSEHEYTQKWIREFLFMIILSSLVLFLVFPDVGFSINGRYFHGILNHPQAMGLAAASITVLLISQIYNKNKSNFFLLLKIILGISLLALSGSRTAGISLLSSILITIFLFLIFKLNIIKNKELRVNKFIMLNVLFSSTLILIFHDKILNLLTIFISKTQTLDFSNLLSSYQISRQVLYEPMINNIFQNFYTGIGFGLASDLSSMNIKYFQNIPISAPIEKGVLPISILEEVGIYGFIFFLLWILILIITTFKKGLEKIMVLLTILIFNFGEAGFFSPNGFGMLYLIILTSVVTSRNKLTKPTNVV